MPSFAFCGYFFDFMALFGGKDTILIRLPLKNFRQNGSDLDLGLIWDQ